MSEDIQEPQEAVEEVAPVEELPQVDPELVAEARRYGWKPKDEFTLAPDGWVDADRFLELPSTQAKALRDTKQRLEKELAERDERLARIEATTKKALERARQQERDAYDAKLRAIENAKREAAELGDLNRYDALARQQENIKPPVEPEEPKPAAPRDEAFEQYKQQARWMADNNAYAFAFQAIEAHPEVKALPPIKQVQWVEKKVREYFPEHFEEARPMTPKVDGGGLGVGRKRERGADDLPADVRRVAQQFVADGVYKSVAEYAKDYWEMETGR